MAAATHFWGHPPSIKAWPRDTGSSVPSGVADTPGSLELWTSSSGAGRGLVLDEFEAATSSASFLTSRDKKDETDFGTLINLSADYQF